MNRIEELFKQSKQAYVDCLNSRYPNLPAVLEGQLPVVIYGAGRMGQIFLANLKKKGIAPLAFADSNSSLWGKRLAGLEITNPEVIIKQYNPIAFLIASLLYESEIHAKLQSLNADYLFPLGYLNLMHPDIFISPEYENEFEVLFDAANRQDILNLNELWADEESRRVFHNIIEFRLTLHKRLIHDVFLSENVQYFESGIISVVPQEVFVDCGAFSGDTILEFKKQAKDGFKKIFAFEPDPKNMRNLKQMIEAKEQDRIMPVSAGVYSTSRTIRFMAEGTLDSRISGAQGADAVEVFSLDDYFRDKETPTFIKMDIEGAEEEALLGARGIIQRCAPKLAISVYHRAADLWRLPLLMKKLNKNYRLYLRHYSREIVDTVCYGV